VHAERGRETAQTAAIKTGPGGLMDLDFLAEGGVLERFPESFPALPGIPELLRAAQAGPASEALLLEYAFLRRVEARARWLSGRSVEAVDLAPPAGALVAELVAPGLASEELGARIAAARERIAAAFEAVLAAGTIGALAG
jgi:glutamine synthetase adenylyltransferase